MSSRSARATALHELVRPQGPRSPRARVAIILAIVGLAVAIHLITGGRWTTVLIGLAGATALLAALPRVSWLVKPIGAYVGLWLIFNLLRAGADDTEWADRVLDLVPRFEAWLFGGNLPSAVLQDRFNEPGNVGWHDHGLVAIYLSFFIAPHLVAILLLWRNRRLFWRYVLAMLALFTLAGASFYLIPTSPPWLATVIVPDAGFAQIRRITEQVLAGLNLPYQLFSESARGPVRTSEVRLEPNPIAAMPSIHFAATALIAFPARRAGVTLFGVAIAYTVLMGIALVYLGEHYVVDLVAGGAMTALGWFVAGRVLDKERSKGKVS